MSGLSTAGKNHCHSKNEAVTEEKFLESSVSIIKTHFPIFFYSKTNSRKVHRPARLTSSARSSRSFCTICLFGHVCAHSFFISKSIVPSRVSEHLIMFNDKKWLQARLCFSISAETLLDVFGDKQPTNLHPLSHRFQDFQSTEILWWITDHSSFGLSLFLTTNWVRVHSGTHSTLLFWSCCQAAQPGQQHESNWDLVLTLPGEKQVRPRAGTGYTLLQRSWQARAQHHHHRRWSKSSASETRGASLQTGVNTHLAVVTTVLYGCKTRTSYSCQGKYFSRFHRHCSCILVTIKWQGKIPSSEALRIVKHWILKKCSYTLKSTDLVLCYICILTSHRKLLS